MDQVCRMYQLERLRRSRRCTKQGRMVSFLTPAVSVRARPDTSGPQKKHRHPVGSGDRGIIHNDQSAWFELIELDLAHLDIVLAVLFGDGSGHGALLGFRADRLMVLLAACGVEPVNDLLVAVLYLDDR